MEKYLQPRERVGTGEEEEGTKEECGESWKGAVAPCDDEGVMMSW